MDLYWRARTVLVWTLCLIQELHSAIDNSGCFASFQVWKPSEDILHRLSSLEFKCTNNTLAWEKGLNRVREQVTYEILAARNVSHKMEKELLEQKLEDVQLKIQMQDLKLELVEMRSDTNELRSLVDGPMSIRHRGHKARIHNSNELSRIDNKDRVTQTEFAKLKSEMGGMKGLFGQVKNGVGDLKAEWLLIKREVGEIKVETNHIKEDQTDITQLTHRLHGAVDALQGDTARLKANQDEIRAVSDKIKKSISDMASYGTKPNSFEEQERRNRLDRQLNDLKSHNTELQRQIERIRTENSELKKEVLAVALAGRNVSRSEVGDWLNKLPNLQLPKFTDTKKQQDGHPKDCHDVYNRGFHTSGVYQIKPRDARQLDNVYCEMVNGTGWTVIQRRLDGTMSFNRRWLEYKFGFGGLYGEFWLGNEMIHWLTSQRQCRLRVDMWDWEGGKAYAEYNYFKVDSETDKFTLHVRGYDGNAGDSLSFHDQMAFSTEDSDNDLHMRNCAVENKGGWWFNSCYTANLNGLYHTGWYSHSAQTYADGVVWFTLKESEFYSLKHVEMKVRPAYL